MAVIIGGGTGNAISINNSVGTNGQVITSNGTDSSWTTLSTSAFSAGTLMLFQQTAAPTGWTKQTTHNNKALRVVSGTATPGGTTAFTSVFASRSFSGTVNDTTLSLTQIPSHNHTANNTLATTGISPGGIEGSPPVLRPPTPTATTSSSGGSAAHSHTFTGSSVDFNVQYVDIIIASKD